MDSTEYDMSVNYFMFDSERSKEENKSFIIKHPNSVISLPKGLSFINWTVNAEYLKPLKNYSISIKDKPDLNVYIAHFDESKKYFIEGRRDADKIFNLIVEYEKAGKEDWP